MENNEVAQIVCTMQYIHSDIKMYSLESLVQINADISNTVFGPKNLIHWPLKKMHVVLIM